LRSAFKIRAEAWLVVDRTDVHFGHPGGSPAVLTKYVGKKVAAAVRWTKTPRKFFNELRGVGP